MTWKENDTASQAATEKKKRWYSLFSFVSIGERFTRCTFHLHMSTHLCTYMWAFKLWAAKELLILQSIFYFLYEDDLEFTNV